MNIGTAAQNLRFDGSCLENPLAEEWLLHNLSHEVRAALNSISSPTNYEKDAVLFVEGQRPLGVFLLRSGTVKLSTSSAEGKSLIVGRAGAGSVLGLPTAISGKPNELTAEALKPVHCSFIARDAFRQFLLEHGTAALRVADILSDMYDAAFAQVRYLGLSASAAEKLARLILELPASEPRDNGHLRTLPHTHKEIAEIIGVSRETVTRLFTRFKREQLVQVNDSRLHILDRTGLEELLA